ncbi:MAG: deoxyribonuclease IV [Anaerovoracaceae bacterium]|nr:deoxyribonuclease IV [Anaerovoracaceae bacterium]
MLYIGCHLSSSKGFENMGKEAIGIGANTFQFFTRNPRGGKAKDIDSHDVERFLDMSQSAGFGKLVAHAPYTLNPCSANEKVRDFAFMVMEDDLKRMEYLPGNYYNFHPGSHVGQGVEKGIELIVGVLNKIILPDQSTTVLLETMAGKGSEIGGRFEELKAIIDGVREKDKIGVCMDTCHVSDAGYDIVNDLEGVLQEFDDIVGLERLHALHINDSMNPLGAHKDRHARIGEGHLGMDAIASFISHPALRELPCILETPNELDGYAREIEMLKSEYRGV